MKLKFKNQDFQTDAMNAAADLFAGQEKTRSTFSVVEEKQMSLMTTSASVAQLLSAR